MRSAISTITPPHLPAKKDGTPDRRFGPQEVGNPRNACPFTLADYAVSQQHVTDLEAANVACTLEPNHLDRPESWNIVGRSAYHFLVWRAGNRVIVDTFHSRLSSPHRRHCRSVDAAWNVVREWCELPRAAYAFEAGQAAEVIGRLPAWLTSSPA